MYHSVLAEIHDRWFRSIPESAADHLAAIAAPLVPFDIVDLGCGSGVLLERLRGRTGTIHGYDISSEMTAKCRQRLPEGTFETCALFDVMLPKTDVVTMVGEILSYAASDPEYGAISVGPLLSRVHAALRPGGLFLFDVLGSGHGYAGDFHHEHPEYRIHSVVRMEEDIVVREILSSLKRGGRYEDSVEVHRLRMFDERSLTEVLTSAGFTVRRITQYGQQPILPGRVAFECRR